MTHDPQVARESLFTQVEVTAVGITSAALEHEGDPAFSARLLRQILAAQDRQNELLEELLAQIGTVQKQRSAELTEWQKAHPGLARECGQAADVLARVQATFVSGLTREVLENEENLLDGEFVLTELMDRFGPRLAHLNSLLHFLAQLSKPPKESAPA